MKRRVLPVAVVGVSSVVLACGAALAQPPVAELKTDQVMAVNIPFNFVVDRKAMPAGRYDIGPAGVDGDRLVIQGTRDQGVFVAPDRERSLDPAEANPAVVFDRLDGRYHLAGARFPGVNGFSLRVSALTSAERHSPA